MQIIGIVISIWTLLQLCLAVDWTCTYGVHGTFGYFCVVGGVKLVNTIVPVNIKGTHQRFKNDDDVRLFEIESTSVYYIPPVIFRKFKKMDLLVVDRKDIEILNEQTFESAKNLKRLHADYNRVKTLGPKTFSGADKLEVIRLGVNLISEIDRTAFWGLFNLKELNLGTNRIWYLHKKTFESCPNLENLFLDKNVIMTLWPDMFKYVVKFSHLTMNNNECINKDFKDTLGFQLEHDLLSCLRPKSLYDEFKSFENDTHRDYSLDVKVAQDETNQLLQKAKEELKGKIKNLSSSINQHSQLFLDVQGKFNLTDHQLEFLLNTSLVLNKKLDMLNKDLLKKIQTLSDEKSRELLEARGDLEKEIQELNEKMIEEYQELKNELENLTSCFQNFQNNTEIFQIDTDNKFKEVHGIYSDLSAKLDSSIEEVVRVINRTKGILEDDLKETSRNLREEFKDSINKTNLEVDNLREFQETMNVVLTQDVPSNFSNLKYKLKSTEVALRHDMKEDYEKLSETARKNHQNQTDELKDLEEKSFSKIQLLEETTSTNFTKAQENLEALEKREKEALLETQKDISTKFQNLQEIDEAIKSDLSENVKKLQEKLETSENTIKQSMLENFENLTTGIDFLAKTKMDNFDLPGMLRDFNETLQKQIEDKFLEMKDELARLQESLFETMSATIINITDYRNYTEEIEPKPDYQIEMEMKVQELIDKNFNTMMLVLVGLFITLFSALKGMCAGDDEEGGGGGGGGMPSAPGISIEPSLNVEAKVEANVEASANLNVEATANISGNLVADSVVSDAVGAVGVGVQATGSVKPSVSTSFSFGF